MEKKDQPLDYNPKVEFIILLIVEGSRQIFVNSSAVYPVDQCTDRNECTSYYAADYLLLPTHDDALDTLL